MHRISTVLFALLLPLGLASAAPSEHASTALHDADADNSAKLTSKQPVSAAEIGRAHV